MLGHDPSGLQGNCDAGPCRTIRPIGIQNRAPDLVFRAEESAFVLPGDLQNEPPRVVGRQDRNRNVWLSYLPVLGEGSNWRVSHGLCVDAIERDYCDDRRVPIWLVRPRNRKQRIYFPDLITCKARTRKFALLARAKLLFWVELARIRDLHRDQVRCRLGNSPFRDVKFKFGAVNVLVPPQLLFRGLG